MSLRSTICAVCTLQLLLIVGWCLLLLHRRFKSRLQRSVQLFPSSSAAGPDGLRPQHLKDLLVGAPNNSQLLVAVTYLTNLLLEGKTPSSVRSSLFGASLLAIRKKNGGIRPIAVGYVWRRLTAKIACSHAREVSVTAGTQTAGLRDCRRCRGSGPCSQEIRRKHELRAGVHSNSLQERFQYTAKRLHPGSSRQALSGAAGFRTVNNGSSVRSAVR